VQVHAHRLNSLRRLCVRQPHHSRSVRGGLSGLPCDEAQSTSHITGLCRRTHTAVRTCDTARASSVLLVTFCITTFRASCFGHGDFGRRSDTFHSSRDWKTRKKVKQKKLCECDSVCLGAVQWCARLLFGLCCQTPWRTAPQNRKHPWISRWRRET
jgi:hypothetical protein